MPKITGDLKLNKLHANQIVDSSTTTRLTVANNSTGASSPAVLTTGSHEMDVLRLTDQAGNPTHVANKISLANNADKLIMMLSQGGLAVGFPLGGPIGWIAGNGHSGFLIADTGATPFLTDGGLHKGVTTTGTLAQTSSATGQYTQFTSGTTSGNEAGVETTNALVRRTYRTWLLTKFSLPSIANIRMFIGFTDQSLATMVSADDPAGNYVGIQFSSDRGDTTWQHVKKNGTTQTKTDTTITADTAVWNTRVFAYAGGIIVQLFNSTFVHQKLTAYITSNPATATQFRYVAGIETRTSAAKDLIFYYSYMAGED